MDKVELWDSRFLELASLISSWSKDPSTKVGAVIVDDKKRIVSVGYNGFAHDTTDNPDLYNNREEKYKRIIHGEINAILFASRQLDGCTLYTVPFMPCPRCSSIIIQVGIKRVISYKTNNDRWSDDFKISRELFKEANIELKEY